MLLEVERKVQERLAQHAVMVQDQGNEQSPDATIAIQEWVDGFELHEGERRLDQCSFYSFPRE